MHHPAPTTPVAQRLGALAMSAALTTLLLLSIGAQADSRHADALAAAQPHATQALCAHAPRPVRG